MTKLQQTYPTALNNTQFILRAIVLHPFLRELQRFNTNSRPIALVACSLRMAAGPLPELYSLRNQ